MTHTELTHTLHAPTSVNRVFHLNKQVNYERLILVNGFKSLNQNPTHRYCSQTYVHVLTHKCSVLQDLIYLFTHFHTHMYSQTH